MIDPVRPLWQLLLIARADDDERTLTCSDCFSILEYLSSVAVIAGLEEAELNSLAQSHMKKCPDCVTYYADLLEKLAQFAARGL
jgi:hypothetical protein